MPEKVVLYWFKSMTRLLSLWLKYADHLGDLTRG